MMKEEEAVEAILEVLEHPAAHVQGFPPHGPLRTDQALRGLDTLREKLREQEAAIQSITEDRDKADSDFIFKLHKDAEIASLREKLRGLEEELQQAKNAEFTSAQFYDQRDRADALAQKLRAAEEALRLIAAIPLDRLGVDYRAIARTALSQKEVTPGG